MIQGVLQTWSFLLPFTSLSHLYTSILYHHILLVKQTILQLKTADEWWGERMMFMHKAIEATKEIVFSFNVLNLSPSISMDLAANMLFFLKIVETLDFQDNCL